MCRSNKSVNLLEKHLSVSTIDPMTDCLKIGKYTFNSRLLIGSGKFPSPQIMRESILASASEVVTVALRRINLNNAEDPIMSQLSDLPITFMPNTSGARDAGEAIRLSKLARSLSGSNCVKLEVVPQPDHLLPDPIETLKAAEALVKLDFDVFPYINADPILAKRLEEVGCVAVMPLAAPIGTNLGLENKHQIQIIIDNANVPVIVDAGIGSPSHACEAMEMGVDAIMLNTAIATATDPISMSTAFKKAIEAGRLAYLSGIALESYQAQASSPLTGFLHE